MAKGESKGVGGGGNGGNKGSGQPPSGTGGDGKGELKGVGSYSTYEEYLAAEMAKVGKQPTKGQAPAPPPVEPPTETKAGTKSMASAVSAPAQGEIQPTKTLPIVQQRAETPITSTEGLIGVQSQYAEQHPEAVVKIGDQYYRPAISAAQTGGQLISGEEERQMFADVLAGIKSGKRAWGGSAGWTEEKAIEEAITALKDCEIKSEKGEVQYDPILIMEALEKGKITVGHLNALFGEAKTVELIRGFNNYWEAIPQAYKTKGTPISEVVSGYQSDLVKMPTIQVMGFDLSAIKAGMTAFSQALSEGKSWQEATEIAQQAKGNVVVFDTEQIWGNPELEGIFEKFLGEESYNKAKDYHEAYKVAVNCGCIGDDGLFNVQKAKEAGMTDEQLTALGITIGGVEIPQFPTGWKITSADDINRVINAVGFVESDINVPRVRAIAQRLGLNPPGGVGESIASGVLAYDEGTFRQWWDKQDDAAKEQIALLYTDTYGGGLMNTWQHHLDYATLEVMKFFGADEPKQRMTVEEVGDIADSSKSWYHRMAYDLTAGRNPWSMLYGMGSNISYGEYNRAWLLGELREATGNAKLDESEMPQAWAALSEEQKQSIAASYTTRTQFIASKLAQAQENVGDWMFATPELPKEPETELTPQQELINRVMNPQTEGGGREIEQFFRGVAGGISEVVLGAGGIANTILGATDPKTPINETAANLAIVPIGMATFVMVQLPTNIARSPATGIGEVAGAFAVPEMVRGVIFSAGKARATATTMFAEDGVLPRAYQSGGIELGRLKVPKEFLEHFSAEQLREIFLKDHTPAEQIALVAEYLKDRPASVKYFTDSLEMAQDLATWRSPDWMIQPVDKTFAKVGDLPMDTARALADWARRNRDTVKMGGSVADEAQGFIIGAKDFDIEVRGSMTPAQARAELQAIFKRTGTKWNDALFDIHIEGRFGKMPYGMDDLIPPDITIDGVRFATIGEQILRRTNSSIAPGVAPSRGLLGQTTTTLPKGAVGGWEVSTHIGRLKDIFRLQMEAQQMINIIRRSGDVARADKLQALLDTSTNYWRLLEEERIKPLPAEEEMAYRQAIIDVVGRAQNEALKRGVPQEITAYEPLTGGLLTRKTSPASMVLDNTVYHATRDVRPYIEAAKKQGYFDAGWIVDETGNLIRAPRNDVFASQNVAFDFLVDPLTGKVPENAAIIAIRITENDVRSGALTPAFRIEYDAKSRPVIYDEHIFHYSQPAYTTIPNARALSGRGISEGITGESITYYPRTNQKIPVIYFATESAKELGLGAPTKAQIHAINIAALKALVDDLWHPRLPEKVAFSAEMPRIKRGLVEFHDDVFSWKGKSPKEVAEYFNGKNGKATELEAQVVERVKAKYGDEVVKRMSDEEYARAFNEELNILAGEQEAAVVRAGGDVLKNTDPQTIANTYFINITEIVDKLAVAGMAGANTLDEVKPSDIELPTMEQYSEAISELSTLEQPEETAFIELTPNEPSVSSASVEILGSSEPKPTRLPSAETISLPEMTTEGMPPTTEERVGVSPTKPTIPPSRKTTIIGTTPPASPTTAPPTMTTPITPPPTTKTSAIPIPLPAGVGKKGVEIKPGTVTWRQGAKWVIIPPPYQQEDVFYLDDPPPGIFRYAEGKGSAYKTIQVLGLPSGQSFMDRSADIDIGWAQVHIEAGKEPVLSFSGGEEAAEERWEQERAEEAQQEREQIIAETLARREEPVIETVVPEQVEYREEQEVEPMETEQELVEARVGGNGKKPIEEIPEKPQETKEPVFGGEPSLGGEPTLGGEVEIAREFEPKELNLGSEISLEKSATRQEVGLGDEIELKEPEQQEEIEVREYEQPEEVEVREPSLGEEVLQRENIIPSRRRTPSLSNADIEYEEDEEIPQRQTKKVRVKPRLIGGDNLPTRYYLGRQLRPSEVRAEIK